MKTIFILRDKQQDLRFQGKLIARVVSQDTAFVERWTELYLYLTKAGKYVAQEIGKTLVPGERDRYSAQVCDTEAEVVRYLGTNWLAKKLYEQAGIEAVEEVA
jgi:hypothetical protein